MRRARHGFVGSLAFLWGATGCTKAGGFFEFLKQKVGVSSSSPSAVLASEVTPLDKAALLEQLKGIAVSPFAEPSNEAAPEFMICDGERTVRNSVVAGDGKITVDYEAEADVCIGANYKAALTEGVKLSGGVGLAHFHYVVDCPAAPKELAATLKAAQFFSTQTIRLDGPEMACFALGGGAGFALDAAVSSGVDAQDPRDAKKSMRFDAKRSLAVHAEDGGPCRVEMKDKTTTIKGVCVHVATSRSSTKSTFAEPTLLAVTVRASLKDVAAVAGERYYSAGSMQLDVNGWRGTVRFSDGKEAPVADLARGGETVRVKLNGEYTGETR